MHINIFLDINITSHWYPRRVGSIREGNMSGGGGKNLESFVSCLEKELLDFCRPGFPPKMALVQTAAYKLTGFQSLGTSPASLPRWVHASTCPVHRPAAPHAAQGVVSVASRGCHNTSPPTWWPNRKETWSLLAVEARSLKAMSHSLQGSRENPSLPLPASRSPRHPQACAVGVQSLFPPARAFSPPLWLKSPSAFL